MFARAKMYYKWRRESINADIARGWTLGLPFLINNPLLSIYKRAGPLNFKNENAE